MRILLIEDDEILTDVLLKSLAHYHYVVDVATDGKAGLNCAQSANYDLILLDVGLPKLDGITLCQRLRSEGCKTPILLMTARDEKRDRIRGLDAGADDYLFKPLDVEELQARVRALIRRGEVAPTPILQSGALRLDPSSCLVSYGDKLLTLTPKEYNLLELFLRNPGRVYSRGQIVEHLWTFDDPPLEDSVKGHIKTLRQKLRKVSGSDWIENVYGVGYRLATENKPEQPAVDKYKQDMEALWERHQDLMVQRLAILQQAAIALSQNTLTAELQNDAKQAAHKLVGVLGMFERDEGTQLARQIEQIVRQETELTTQAQPLSLLVQQLERSLNLHSPTSQPVTLTPPNPSHSIQILVVDDDPVFLAALSPMLNPWDIQVNGLEDPLKFWDVLKATNPDLLILDVDMPHQNGIELCQAVRNDTTWQDIPILFVTARSDRPTIQAIFAAGADDYITKPVVGEELLTRITNRLERNRLLKKLSITDAVTGLLNQMHTSRCLNTWIRQNQPFCFAVFTIEDLQEINFQYGHHAGNQVLQRWGSLFSAEFCDQEVLGYWGNGDFVISKHAISDITPTLENFSTKLRQQIFTANSDRFQTYFRLGIANYPADGSTLQALYQVARGGQR